ncbi:MAG: hypothetical protein ACR2NW_02160 [Thermodesulfobacteriota bacterium]
MDIKKKEHKTNKSSIDLDNIPQYPGGLEDAVEFPLLEALIGRRSRRFSLGAEIPDGKFGFSSKHDPLPLSELEQIMILTSVTGNTGWQYLIPYNKNYLPNIPNYEMSAGGRICPSSAGFHTSELFYTDDNGVYFLPTRDAPSLTELDSENSLDLKDYLDKHRSRIQKIFDKRLHIPRNTDHMEAHNHWCANTPGSTLIIPVADLAQQHLGTLCYLVQNEKCIYDDIHNNQVPGMVRFSNIVDVDNPLPLSFIEQLSLTGLTVEISTSCYAGMLMLQAIGLGGWMYNGINPFSVLGASGDPEVTGLGFRYDTDERWPLPNVTGLPGVLEGYCPPHYANMKEAVEAVVKRKFGPGGPFNEGTPGPYSDNPGVRSGGKVHNDEFKECVTTIAQYIYDGFGKFPATIPSIFIVMYLQAHHLELEYYDNYFRGQAYLDTHANHMKNWHSE